MRYFKISLSLKKEKIKELEKIQIKKKFSTLRNFPLNLNFSQQKKKDNNNKKKESINLKTALNHPCSPFSQ